MRGKIVCSWIILTLIITLIAIPGGESQSTDNEPPKAFLTNPYANNVTKETTPLLVIQIVDESNIDMDNIKLEAYGFDDLDEWEETTINQTTITHQISPIFALNNGNHTVKLSISDEHGNEADYAWNFTVNTNLKEERESVNYFRIFVIAIVIVVVIALITLLSIGIYLKVTKDFNFVKFYRRHPINKEKSLIITPIVIGILVFLGGLLYYYQYDINEEYYMEYLVIASFFLIFTSLTIQAQMEKNSIINYEHGFSQLLFELADAMRGGIDPAKAIVELSNTNTGTLSKQLKIGAKNIKAGRPFEEVLLTIAEPTNSKIIARYASLIGESSKVGGEIAQVIHRSAKDMEDMLKVVSERRRQLVIQTFTIYIAFFVLVAIMWMLIGIYPQLTEIDFTFFTDFNLEAAAASADETTTSIRMSITDIKRKFFHVILINSMGSGLIIGKLIHGKIKYGLLHSIILVGMASLIFFLFIF